MNYLQSLHSDDRERVFQAMRSIGERAEVFRSRYRSLCPGPLKIPVGATHYDELFRMESLDHFLRKLRAGYTPKESHRLTTITVNEFIDRWNKSGHGGCAFINKPSELDRWPGMCDALLDWALALILEAEQDWTL